MVVDVPFCGASDRGKYAVLFLTFSAVGAHLTHQNVATMVLEACTALATYAVNGAFSNRMDETHNFLDETSREIQCMVHPPNQLHKKDWQHGQNEHEPLGTDSTVAIEICTNRPRALRCVQVKWDNVK